MATRGTRTTPEDHDPAAEARRAARRAGMSLSEWLDAVLREPPEAPTRNRRYDDPQAPRDLPEVRERRAASPDVEHRLDRLVGAIGSEHHQTATPAEDDGERESLHGIASRLDRLSARPPAGQDTPSPRHTVRELEERLQDIARRMDARQRPALSLRTPQSGSGFAEVSPVPIDGLKEAIAEIASRQKTLEVEFDRAVSGYADRVDHRLDMVAERLEQTIGAALPGERIQEIHHLLQDIVTRAGTGADPAPEIAEMKFLVTDTARRIDTLSGELADMLAEKLEDAVRRLDTATRAEIDAIRAEIREIGQEIDQTTRSEFVALRSELGRLAQTIESMPSADTGGIEEKIETIALRLGQAAQEEFGALRSEMREISAQIEQAGRDDIEALRSEIARLADRIEALPGPGTASIETQLEDIAARLDTAARGEFETLRIELRELGDRLLDGRAGLAAADQAGGADIAELDAIRTDIRSLAEQIDGVRRDDYTSLRRDMQALGERFAQQPTGRVDEIEKQLSQLGESLAGAAQDGDTEALAQIEQQIGRLAESVDQSSRQFVGVGDLEKAIGELFTRIEDSRSDAMSAAREAATQAIERVLSALPNTANESDLFTAIRDELASQRTDAEAADQRTQLALRSVHDTLMRVVDRIEDLEDEVDEFASDIKETDLPPRADIPVSRSRASDSAGTTGFADAPVDSALPEAPMKPSAAAPEDKVEPAAKEDDTPLVPGSGRPDAAPNGRGDATPAGLTAPASSSDFVAAARRAAQAAAAEQSGKPKVAAKPKKSPFGGLRETLSKYRRPLAVAAAMLVLVYGSMEIASLMQSDPQEIADSAEQSPTPSAAMVASLPPSTEAADSISDKMAKPAKAKSGPGKSEKTKSGTKKAATERGSSKKTANQKADEPKQPRQIKTTPDPKTPKAEVASASPAKPITGDSTGSIPNPAKAKVETAGKPATSTDAKDAPAPQGLLNVPANAAATDLPANAAPERLRQAAAAGDPTAEFEVAMRYMDGRGLPQDSAKAVEWYRKAAAQGLPPAQYRLGSLYEKGQGVDRDLAMARMWYQRAAEQGNRKAMHNLAVLYADGVDGKPDYEKAAMWFRQAAEYGLTDSQFNLAVLYARGLGVEADFGEAFRWFAIAADQGDTEALQKRDEVARELDQEGLMKARTALDAWKAKELVTSANVVAEPQGGWGDVLPSRQAFVDRDMIAEVQARLGDLGYAPGPPDGQIGPRTKEAVRAYQRNVGLPETGEITPELLDRLDQPSG